MMRLPPPADTAELWALPAIACNLARPDTLDEFILAGFILRFLCYDELFTIVYSGISFFYINLESNIGLLFSWGLKKPGFWEIGLFG